MSLGDLAASAAVPDRQPWLHDLVALVHAPAQAWSLPSGQIRPGGASGLYLGDRRVVRRLELAVDGAEPEPVAHHADGPGRHVFLVVPRRAAETVDEPVRIERHRQVLPDAVEERLVVRSFATHQIEVVLTLDVEADLAPLDAIKMGRATPPVAATLDGSTLRWDGPSSAALHAPGASIDAQGGGARLRWTVEVPAAASTEVGLRLSMTDPGAAAGPPSCSSTWTEPQVASEDRRLAPVLARSLADLRLLRLVLAGEQDEFVAAGAPWFLTLFGRDSLWTARMLLPVSTELAASTLRVLAARQGRRVDARSCEEPGKILHELRAQPVHLGEAPGDPVGHPRSLPPVYYGTIDATPLWVLTLADAFRWGLPEASVEALRPNLEAALAWMVEHGDRDGDFLLEYDDTSGLGLANQGWKDSGDAIRRLDGSLARAPIALCEVQGYAHAAALAGADLLEALGGGGTDRWREWAARLRRAFRERFWVQDELGPFPAIALDGEKKPVESVTSNMGHLLGTGLLDPAEVDLVARRLAAPDLLSGFGIRTLSSRAAGYSPTGYHVGSVWPHDTAICLAGLAAEQRPETAPVAEALLRALTAFDGRPPELFCGDPADEHPVPVPYPASCRPQAWAAASAVSLVTSLLGLSADVPNGRVSASPASPWALGATTVKDLRAGSSALSVSVDEQGAATVDWRP